MSSDKRVGTAVQRSSPKPGVLERTLANITGSLEATLFAEELTRQKGLLQGLDPRVKIVTFLALLLAVGLSRSLAIIAGLYVLALVLAWRSAVPLGFFVKRVWLFMPFFTGIVAVPAIFSFITPGTAVFTLACWGGGGDGSLTAVPTISLTAVSTVSPTCLTITEQGLRTAAFLLLRVGTSVSFAILLILTTPWNILLKALGVLRVPKIFILILSMTHRYIYLLLHTANDMFLARKSRVVGRMPTGDQRRMLTATMGTLLDKSYHLSNEVYLAMLSRGFRGQPRVLETFQLRPQDWVWGFAMCGVAGMSIWLGQ